MQPQDDGVCFKERSLPSVIQPVIQHTGIRFSLTLGLLAGSVLLLSGGLGWLPSLVQAQPVAVSKPAAKKALTPSPRLSSPVASRVAPAAKPPAKAPGKPPQKPVSAPQAKLANGSANKGVATAKPISGKPLSVKPQSLPVVSSALLVNALQYDRVRQTLTIQGGSSTRPLKGKIYTTTQAGRRHVMLDVLNAEKSRQFPSDSALYSVLKSQWPGLTNIAVIQLRDQDSVVRVLLDIAETQETASMEPRLESASQGALSLKLFSRAATIAEKPAIKPVLSHTPQAPKTTSPTSSVAALAVSQSVSSASAVTPEKTDVPSANRGHGWLPNRAFKWLPGAGRPADDSETANNQAAKVQLAASSEGVVKVPAIFPKTPAAKSPSATTSSPATDLSTDAQAYSAVQVEPSASNGSTASGISISRPAAAPATASAISVDERKLRLTLAVLHEKYTDAIQENFRLKTELEAAQERVQQALQQKETLQASAPTSAHTVHTVSAANMPSGTGSVVAATDDSAMVVQLQNVLMERDRRIAELLREKSKAAKVSSAMPSTVVKASSPAVSTHSDHAEKLKQMADTIAQLNQEKQRLTAQLATANQKNATLAQALSKPVVPSSDSSLPVAMAATTVTSGLAASTPTSPDVEQRLKDARAHLAEAFKTINDQNRRIVSLRERLEKLESNLDQAAKDQIQRLSQELQQSQATIATLKGKGASAQARTGGTAEREQLQDQLTGLQALYEENLKQLSLAQQRAKLLESQLSQAGVERATTPVASIATPAAPGPAPAKPEKQSRSDRAAETAASVEQAWQHYQEGLALLGKERRFDAMKHFEQAAALNRYEPRFVVAIADVLLAQDRSDEVIQLLQPWIDRPEASNELFNTLGKAYLIRHNPTQSLETLAKGVPVNVLSNYASALRQLGRVPEALGVLQTAIAIQPNDSALHFNMGNLQAYQQAYPQAQQAFETALRLKSDFAQAHYNLGVVLDKMGQPREATVHLERYLGLEPRAENRKEVQRYIQTLKQQQKSTKASL
ncbi:MAG: tetratricopeptide repeat protein [Candidatus Melainabacteria bacterium]|nr:tetratricopeptide repeat protein [Candidatus Melainabacteria bacterium]